MYFTKIKLDINKISFKKKDVLKYNIELATLLADAKASKCMHDAYHKELNWRYHQGAIYLYVCHRQCWVIIGEVKVDVIMILLSFGNPGRSPLLLKSSQNQPHSSK